MKKENEDMSDVKRLSHKSQLRNGNNLRVDSLGSGIFRIRVSEGDCLHESGLNRYGIIKIKPDLQSGPVKISEEADGWTLTDSEAALHVNADDGKVCLKEKKGGVVLEGCEQKTKSDGHGFAISFRLGKGERLYGKHGV